MSKNIEIEHQKNVCAPMELSQTTSTTCNARCDMYVLRN